MPVGTQAKKHARSRRKKRRTTDFSDSSSSEESEHEPTTNDINSKSEIKNESRSLDMVPPSVDEPVTNVNEHISYKEVMEMARVRFTDTPLTKNENSVKSQAIVTESAEIVQRDNSEYENEYLKLMAESFSEDIDELRRKPDFTDKSVVLLAKALQSGVNMFDKETLRSFPGFT